ncbi:peptide/nickel transport system permease protein [Neomicrococcus aestuarii]|uniref:Peptide/nickel transport system permease protein n=1 Tax=Neomicrococcus aestuarii TaxID=556325 RepID=A0A7W8TX81_9MICC|nr:ABC transporter permease [Neomicrococcus aestuarii]MBB5513643.1 peptide/nickel transport system permease protein [Neomicrococcus aestuarii]
MVTYIVRRLIAAVLILLGASFIVYQLTALSGDPLADLRESNNPNKEALMAARAQALDLGTPAPLRYFKWIGGAAQCLIPFAAKCDLGVNLVGAPVTEALGRAMGQTILLVTAATFLAIFIGIALGIISALRQYSALDYGVTFMAFLFFSLPIFWLAVLLKEYGAIGFNDFLKNPVFSPAAIVIASIFMGIVVVVFMRGGFVRRAIGFVIGAAVTAGLMALLSATGWFRNPGLGPVLIVLFGVAAAFLVTQLVSGIRNRRALYSALIMVAVGLISYYALNPLFGNMSWWGIFAGAVVCIIIGCAVGYFMGGYDRGQSMRAASITALLMGGLVVLDRFMIEWPNYFDNSRVRGRPIATIGSNTPNLQGDWWIQTTDTFTHLLLPTIALMLVSLAGYSRYSRASMLEIMQQDYIRTARAKGLPERTVVMRHAFRNALIPLATLVAFDIGGLIGGAVVTERVFAFTGMGDLFVHSLVPIPDPNPVMGTFLVIGIVALIFNLIADLVYSVLDPRVRVKA